jgi:hypothetical protein
MERAEELLRTRERIARLRSGDRLFVSEEVADYLDQNSTSWALARVGCRWNATAGS